MVKKTVGTASVKMRPTGIDQKGSQSSGRASSSLVSMKLGMGSNSGSWNCICMVMPMP